MHLRKIIGTVFDVDYPNRENPFGKVRLAEHTKGKRPPFSETEIATLQAMFDASNINEELKAINFIAMNTGATCKEICLLTTGDIHLNEPVPYIRIADNEFRDRVKSGGARHRHVPIIGVALVWLRKFPDGFPRYRRENGSEAVSAASNKSIAEVVPGKTFYSYRHSISDLLRNSGCSDSLKDSIMGHTTPGMGSHYGAGFHLETKEAALRKALNLNTDANEDK